MSGLRLEKLRKCFESTRAVDGVSFSIDQGEIVAVLGPSGSGKSTLLALIAGLLDPDEGQVLWNEVSLRDIPPFKRDFGLMFQDLALFPHMNVYQNVAFGLRMADQTADQIRLRVKEVLELVDLAGFGAREVNTLSGGEQQRVALARALAPEPRLLMLDEPLGALDRALRERLLRELKDILRRLRQTALYVTHDQEEAFALADRVVVMNRGRVLQIGTPEEIYRSPQSAFIARFLGMDNVMAGNVRMIEGERMVETSIGCFPVADWPMGKVTLLIRPEAALLDGKGDLQLEGEIIERSFRGGICRAVFEIHGEKLSFDFNANVALPAEGSHIGISFVVGEAIRILGE